MKSDSSKAEDKNTPSRPTESAVVAEDLETSATVIDGKSHQGLSLRAQKKLLSRLAASNAGRSLLIDDATTSLLDNLRKLMDQTAKTSKQLDKMQPEKVFKNIIKIATKVGLLYLNQQLGPDDVVRIAEVRQAMRAAALDVISVHEIEFSYDQAHLIGRFEDCRNAVKALIEPHLTDKSRQRCDLVFDFLSHPDFLDMVFTSQIDSELQSMLMALVADINRVIEAGQL